MIETESVILPFPRRPFTAPVTEKVWSGDQEMIGLVRWLGRTVDWPTDPFDLIAPGENAMCCLRVLDPAGYRDALLADADRGPQGPNAAGLRANLRRLKVLFGRPRGRGQRLVG